MSTPASYDALRDQIQGLLTEGQVQVKQAGDAEKTETYWHVGDALLSHVSGQERADYGQQIIANLSKDLKLSQSLLYETLLFRRLLPILHARGELSWSHYRRLIHLPTQAAFRFYQHLTRDQALSIRQLDEAIQADLFTAATTTPLAVPVDQDPFAGQPLRPRFGGLYVYRVVPSHNPGAQRLMLDLGFGCVVHQPLVGLSDPKPDSLVACDKSADGSYTFRKLPKNTQRYTYIAWVHRVVDGDTFIGAVDLGLGHETWTLRFRLASIDTPELSTLAGRNARDFTAAALEQVDFVILRTHRTDDYGRYLVDVRYLSGEPDPDVVRREGIYLNRQLLEERLARRYVK